MVLERRPPAVMLSFGDVQPHAHKIKSAGSLLICQVQTLEQAKDAITNGADILVAQGGEAGGHGISRGTFPFVPAARGPSSEDTPVCCGGGNSGRTWACRSAHVGCGWRVGWHEVLCLSGGRWHAVRQEPHRDGNGRPNNSQHLIRHCAAKRLASALFGSSSAERIFGESGAVARLSCSSTRTRRLHDMLRLAQQATSILLRLSRARSST